MILIVVPKITIYISGSTCLWEHKGEMRMKHYLYTKTLQTWGVDLRRSTLKHQWHSGEVYATRVKYWHHYMIYDCQWRTQPPSFIPTSGAPIQAALYSMYQNRRSGCCVYGDISFKRRHFISSDRIVNWPCTSQLAVMCNAAFCQVTQHAYYQVSNTFAFYFIHLNKIPHAIAVSVVYTFLDTV